MADLSLLNDPAGWERVRRAIFEPGYLDQLIEEGRARSREEWKLDPYYPIRNLRAHGTEPSVNALNTLDGPAVCDGCGATTVGGDDVDADELLHPAEDICYGCGHVICKRESCERLPDDYMGKHTFAFHTGATS